MSEAKQETQSLPLDHDFVATNTEHYNNIADQYEAHQWASELTDRQTTAFLAAYPFDWEVTEMMDFGCGPGLVSRALHGYTKRVVGVDVSQSMVDVFNKFASENNMDSLEAFCVELKGEDKELGGKKFDVIISGMVYHHLPNVAEITKILASYLKPGGSLLVINRLANGKPLPEDLFVRKPNTPDINMNMSAFERLVAHKDGFTETELREIFEGAGLVKFEMRVLSKARGHEFPFPLFIAKGVKPKASN
ncbi:hypothetical protein ONZ45_g3353 [Pleurotus djamor]|nr:hypothetical protein ONZ45_g3353 [Pleurotus djamor]